MKSISDIRRENTKSIIDKQFDGNQSKLARALGYENPSIVSRLVADNPNSRKNIGSNLARRIETAAGLPQHWLDQKQHTVHQPQPPQYRVNELTPTPRNLPVISWVQAGSWSETADPHQPGVAEEWMPSPIRCGPSSFYLRVRGASMEPRFQDGDFVVVDPDAEPRNKSFVIVRLDDSKEATFKQLIIEGNRRYLNALNPAWPERIIEINGNATICGVVIFKGEKI